MARQLPSETDYMMVLQNLRISLIPAQLKQAEPVLNKRNAPLTFSGGFVLTSPIRVTSASGTKKLALRLFKQLPDAMEQRYREISAFVKLNSATGLFTDVSYIEQGVKVNNMVLPICTMDWLEGDTLRSYISKNLNDAAKITPLADKFQAMIVKLRRTGGAHGDLSHDNIMVSNGELILIDYDGMFVPSLNGQPPVVAGQANFQHPMRIVTPGYFGSYQDNFSSICIYISLLALRHDPSLFTRYEDGSNLIFKKSDFKAPDNSQLFSDLVKITAMRDMVERFRDVCKVDVLQTPNLQEFLSGKRVVTSQALNSTAVATFAQSGVFVNTEGALFLSAASPNRELLRSAQGQLATLAGRVHRTELQVHSIMLEFNSGAGVTSAVFIEGDGFEKLRKKGTAAIQTYTNAWLKVTGVIEMNTLGGEEVPCIVTDSLQDIVVKTGEEIRGLLQNRGENRVVSQAPQEKANKSWIRSQRPPTTSPVNSATSSANTGNTDNLFNPSIKKKNPFGPLDDL